MNVLEKIKHHGLRGSSRKGLNLLKRKGVYAYAKWRFRKAPVFSDPTPDELKTIEHDLATLNIPVIDHAPSPEAFRAFQAENFFPDDYHGGRNGAVWQEKLLEHWITSERLGLANYKPEDLYVDIAAGGSPWAKSLRERKKISAFAIDLNIAETHRHLPYYRIEDAARTSFSAGAVKGASLHCAYEMFMGDDDTRLIHEAARILTPDGGKIVIAPLYIHTHYCAFAAPEYYNKGKADRLAKEYIRMDMREVPSARFCDAAMLKHRVLDPIESLGMRYQLLALRNKMDLGDGIYCHFILEILR